MIFFKTGVEFKAVEPVLLRGMADMADLWSQRFPNVPFTVTSVNDGTHLVTSWHYKGRAFDFRTHEVPSQGAASVILDYRAYHPDWVVLFEARGTPGEHGHAQVPG